MTRSELSPSACKKKKNDPRTEQHLLIVEQMVTLGNEKENCIQVTGIRLQVMETESQF